MRLREGEAREALHRTRLCLVACPSRRSDEGSSSIIATSFCDVSIASQIFRKVFKNKIVRRDLVVTPDKDLSESRSIIIVRDNNSANSPKPSTFKTLCSELFQSGNGGACSAAFSSMSDRIISR
ncbi:hypothetical protein V1291_005127 [Nitrobacteraceae bacterium AZCC 1564]